jgi:23S rRNA (uracil1939-C5)-methyltransferase
VEPSSSCCPDEPGTLVVTIDGLANGPDAVARDHGRVVFVRGGAPGDRARVRVLDDRGSYVRAELIHRCEPGNAWREPPCPWVRECGGCPWQHVHYPTQLEAKADNVKETLRRIAGIVPTRLLPILAGPEEWAYRHRVRLHGDAQGRIGYRRPRSHRLVEIGHCVIADPAVTRLFAVIRATLPQLASRPETVELAANGRGGAVMVARTLHRWRDDDERVFLRLLAEVPGLAGIRIDGRGWTRTFGDARLTQRLGAETGALTLTFPAGTFSQVNPGANVRLIGVVTAMAGSTARVLDLFCGAGNLSLPLAHAGANVLGVDRDPAAITAARANAEEAGLHARFEAAAADAFLRRQGVQRADLVVLDPPRVGAAAVAAQLARLRPPRILYVSCDPATLARDARILVAGGYRIDRVQPIDLFPQTEHVETVLEAVLTAR